MIFFILSVTLFNITAYLMPKRLTRTENYMIALLALVLGNTADLVFAINYRLYHYFTGNTYLPLLAVGFGLYPSVNIILLNFFPSNKNIKYKIYHVLGCVAFCIIYEIFAVKSGFFSRSGWKIWYSVVVYIFAYVILDYNLNLIRKWNSHRQK